MTERLLLPPDLLDRVTVKLSSLANARRLHQTIQDHYHQERDWYDRHEKKDDVQSREEQAVFLMMSQCARIKDHNAFRAYRDPGAPLHRETQAAMDRYDYLLDTVLSGVSLAEIFDSKIELARQKPAEVYGHMLFSTVPPEDSAVFAIAAINLLPATIYSSDEVRSLVKNSSFPTHINATLRELSAIYQQALSEINKAFFNPDSRHFPAIVQLYEEMASNDNPFYMDVFNAQVLGLTGTEQGRGAYGKLRAIIDQDDAPEIYKKCLIAIEDSFDGLLGEEAYELLAIEQSSSAQPDDDSYLAAHSKKQRLLKQVKDAKGIIYLPDQQYGQLPLLGPQLHYNKHGTQTYVGFTAEVETGDNTIPIAFQLCEQRAYAWSFLRNYTEVPELFNVTVHTLNAILDQAALHIAQSHGGPYGQSTTSKPPYERDPAYDLRKEERRRNKDQAAAQHTFTTGNASTSNVRPLEVEFPPSIAESLDEATLQKAKKAIAKHDSGLLNSKLIRSLSTHGRKIWRLRERDVRVLVEQVEGRLIVLDAGQRKSIYK